MSLADVLHHFGSCTPMKPLSRPFFDAFVGEAVWPFKYQGSYCIGGCSCRNCLYMKASVTYWVFTAYSRAKAFALKACAHYDFVLTPDNVTFQGVLDFETYNKGSCSYVAAMAPVHYILERFWNSAGLSIYNYSLFESSDIGYVDHLSVLTYIVNWFLSTDPDNFVVGCKPSFDSFLDFLDVPKRYFKFTYGVYGSDSVMEHFACHSSDPRSSARFDAIMTWSIKLYYSYLYDRDDFQIKYSVGTDFVDYPILGRVYNDKPCDDVGCIFETTYDSLVTLQTAPSYQKVLSRKSYKYTSGTFCDSCVHQDCFVRRKLAKFTGPYNNVQPVGVASTVSGHTLIPNRLSRVDFKSSREYFYKEFVDSWNSLKFTDVHGNSKSLPLLLPYDGILSPSPGAVFGNSLVASGNVADLDQNFLNYDYGKPASYSCTEFLAAVSYNLYRMDKCIPADTFGNVVDYTHVPKPAGSKSSGICTSAFNQGVLRQLGDYVRFVNQYVNHLTHGFTVWVFEILPKVSVQPLSKTLRTIFLGPSFMSDCYRCFMYCLMDFVKRFCSYSYILIGYKDFSCGINRIIRNLETTLSSAVPRMWISLDYPKFDTRVDDLFQYSFITNHLYFYEAGHVDLVCRGMLQLMANAVAPLVSYNGVFLRKLRGVSSGDGATAIKNSHCNSLLNFISSMRMVLESDSHSPEVKALQSELYHLVVMDSVPTRDKAYGAFRPFENTFGTFVFLSDDAIGVVNSDLFDKTTYLSNFYSLGGYEIEEGSKFFYTEVPYELASRYFFKSGSYWYSAPLVERVFSSIVQMTSSSSLDIEVMGGRLMSILINAWPLVRSSDNYCDVPVRDLMYALYGLVSDYFNRYSYWFSQGFVSIDGDPEVSSVAITAISLVCNTKKFITTTYLDNLWFAHDYVDREKVVNQEYGNKGSLTTCRTPVGSVFALTFCDDLTVSVYQLHKVLYHTNDPVTVVLLGFDDDTYPRVYYDLVELSRIFPGQLHLLDSTVDNLYTTHTFYREAEATGEHNSCSLVQTKVLQRVFSKFMEVKREIMRWNVSHTLDAYKRFDSFRGGSGVYDYTYYHAFDLFKHLYMPESSSFLFWNFEGDGFPQYVIGCSFQTSCHLYTRTVYRFDDNDRFSSYFSLDGVSCDGPKCDYVVATLTDHESCLSLLNPLQLLSPGGTVVLAFRMDGPVSVLRFACYLSTFADSYLFVRPAALHPLDTTVYIVYKSLYSVPFIFDRGVDPNTDSGYFTAFVDFQVGLYRHLLSVLVVFNRYLVDSALSCQTSHVLRSYPLLTSPGQDFLALEGGPVTEPIGSLFCVPCGSPTSFYCLQCTNMGFMMGFCNGPCNCLIRHVAFGHFEFGMKTSKGSRVIQCCDPDCSVVDVRKLYVGRDFTCSDHRSDGSVPLCIAEDASDAYDKFSYGASTIKGHYVTAFDKLISDINTPHLFFQRFYDFSLGYWRYFRLVLEWCAVADEAENPLVEFKVVSTVSKSEAVCVPLTHFSWRVNQNYVIASTNMPASVELKHVNNRDVFRVVSDRLPTTSFKIRVPNPSQSKHLCSLVVWNPVVETVVNFAVKRVTNYGGFNTGSVEDHLLNDNLSVVQGPPGTGKTYLINRLLYTMYSVLQSSRTVVVCAPSHSAVDNVAAGLHNSLIPLARRLVPSESSDKVHTNLAEYRSGGGLVFASIHSVKGLLLSSCEYFICDEFSLMTDVTFFAAICVLKPRHIILVGDPMQLTSIHPFSSSCDFANVINRLISLGRIEPHFLNVSYRMGINLCRFVSEHFYSGRLLCGVSYPGEVQKVVLDPGFSVRVSEYGKAVVAVFNELRSVQGSLAIIATHHNLVSYVRQLIDDDSVYVSTINCAQGRTFDFVLCAFMGDTKFSKCPNIINVGLTRARRLSVAFCSPSNPYFRDVAEYVIPSVMAELAVVETEDRLVIPTSYKHSVRGKTFAPYVSRTHVFTVNECLFAVDFESVTSRDVVAEDGRVLHFPASVGLVSGTGVTFSSPLRPAYKHSSGYYQTQRYTSRLSDGSVNYYALRSAKVGIRTVSEYFISKVFPALVKTVPHVVVLVVKSYLLDMAFLYDCVMYDLDRKHCSDCRSLASFYAGRPYCSKHAQGKIVTHFYNPYVVDIHDMVCMVCFKKDFVKSSGGTIECSCYTSGEPVSTTVNLQTQHSYVCSRSHGAAHDSLSDAYMTLCVYKRSFNRYWRKQYEISPMNVPAVYNCWFDPSLSFVKLLKRCLEVAFAGKQKYCLIGGGAHIKYNNIDLRLGKSYSEHLKTCDGSHVHVFIDSIYHMDVSKDPCPIIGFDKSDVSFQSAYGLYYTLDSARIWFSAYGALRSPLKKTIPFPIYGQCGSVLVDRTSTFLFDVPCCHTPDHIGGMYVYSNICESHAKIISYLDYALVSSKVFRLWMAPDGKTLAKSLSLEFYSVPTVPKFTLKLDSLMVPRSDGPVPLDYFYMAYCVLQKLYLYVPILPRTFTYFCSKPHEVRDSNVLDVFSTYMIPSDTDKCDFLYAILEPPFDSDLFDSLLQRINKGGVLVVNITPKLCHSKYGSVSDQFTVVDLLKPACTYVTTSMFVLYVGYQHRGVHFDVKDEFLRRVQFMIENPWKFQMCYVSPKHIRLDQLVLDKKESVIMEAGCCTHYACVLPTFHTKQRFRRFARAVQGVVPSLPLFACDGYHVTCALARGPLHSYPGLVVSQVRACFNFLLLAPLCVKVYQRRHVVVEFVADANWVSFLSTIRPIITDYGYEIDCHLTTNPHLTLASSPVDLRPEFIIALEELEFSHQPCEFIDFNFGLLASV